MDDTRRREILALMSDVRLAIERVDRSAHSGLRYFPKGSCRWASFVLSRVLADCGEDGWQIRCGEQGPSWLYSHCWLERDGYVLDITADQVESYDAPLLLQSPSPFEAVLQNVRFIPASDIYDHPPILDAYHEVSSVLAAIRKGDAG